MKFHKINPERKQKRKSKKLFSYGLLGVGVVGLIIGLIMLIINTEVEKGMYVSPLARVGFTAGSQKNTKIEQLKKGLQEEKILYTSIKNGDDHTYIVTLGDGGEVTFSSQKDIIDQIASLQYILSHLTMERKLFTRLDLRFEKPVIVLKK